MKHTLTALGLQAHGSAIRAYVAGPAGRSWPESGAPLFFAKIAKIAKTGLSE